MKDAVKSKEQMVARIIRANGSEETIKFTETSSPSERRKGIESILKENGLIKGSLEDYQIGIWNILGNAIARKLLDPPRWTFKVILEAKAGEDFICSKCLLKIDGICKADRKSITVGINEISCESFVPKKDSVVFLWQLILQGRMR